MKTSPIHSAFHPWIRWLCSIRCKADQDLNSFHENKIPSMQVLIEEQKRSPWCALKTSHNKPLLLLLNFPGHIQLELKTWMQAFEVWIVQFSSHSKNQITLNNPDMHLKTGYHLYVPNGQNICSKAWPMLLLCLWWYIHQIARVWKNIFYWSNHSCVLQINMIFLIYHLIS